MDRPKHVIRKLKAKKLKEKRALIVNGRLKCRLLRHGL